jgi:hypothetical protein
MCSDGYVQVVHSRHVVVRLILGVYVCIYINNGQHGPAEKGIHYHISKLVTIPVLPTVRTFALQS